MPDRDREYLAPWARVGILIVALSAAGLASWWLTGSVVPKRSQDSLIFQSGLLLVVLGSAILENKFTRPADSVVNGLAGMVALVTVYSVASRLSWFLVFAYCLVVFVLALACCLVSTGPDLSG